MMTYAELTKLGYKITITKTGYEVFEPHGKIISAIFGFAGYCYEKKLAMAVAKANGYYLTLETYRNKI